MCRFPINPGPNDGTAMVRVSDDHPTEKAQKACADILPTKENAPAATEANFETILNRNYKQLPPYGKQLMAIREAGRVPSHLVMVCFDWKPAKAYPRIVIPADANPAELEFSFLAGIPVQIVYGSKDAHRVDALVQEILLVNPSLLATFAHDLVDTCDALTLIKPYQRTE
jgi:hypothetical protein